MPAFIATKSFDDAAIPHRIWLARVNIFWLFRLEKLSGRYARLATYPQIGMTPFLRLSSIFLKAIPQRMRINKVSQSKWNLKSTGR